MKKINLDKVQDLKPFINYEAVGLELEITEIKEIKNDGMRFTFENLEDGHIQFMKFYLSEEGLPFYKKFVNDANFNSKMASNPMALVGQVVVAELMYVNEKAKITKIVNVSESIPL